MINLIVIVISSIVFVLVLVWWRSPALRDRIEAPKYSMLSQERRFDNWNASNTISGPVRALEPEDS
jgi:hypothetical protein